MDTYGKELILDLHDCYETRFNRRDLKRYFNELCDLIDMEQMKLSWWDYHWWPAWIVNLMGWRDDPKTYGTSAVQFIMTSNITVHIIDDMYNIYLNIFSCKDFDDELVADFTQCFFWDEIVNKTVLEGV